MIKDKIVIYHSESEPEHRYRTCVVKDGKKICGGGKTALKAISVLENDIQKNNSIQKNKK